MNIGIIFIIIVFIGILIRVIMLEIQQIKIIKNTASMLHDIEIQLDNMIENF